MGSYPFGSEGFWEQRETDLEGSGRKGSMELKGIGREALWPPGDMTPKGSGVMPDVTAEAIRWLPEDG